MFLDGKLKINVENYNSIYKFLLTPKNLRKQFNNIDLNFSYNFDRKILNLSDIKIDGNLNENINRNLNDIILKDNKLQNKIYIKNFLNKMIKFYFG